MTRILVLYYSQSGDVSHVTRAFTDPLAGPGVELVRCEVRPTVEYPYPWKSLARLVDVLPECMTHSPPSIEPLPFSPDDRFDLVILAFQVWHFSPSLPIQGFLQSRYAQVLRDTKVITLVTSRNMWHSASQEMKRMLLDLGGRQIDNVAVTHVGPPWTTFVSVPRALLFGRKDSLWGIFPSAEIGEEETERLARLGGVVRDKLHSIGDESCQPLLAGLDAVMVERKLIVPERIACYGGRAWSRLILVVEPAGRWARRALIYAYLLYLLLMILVGLPVAIVLTVISYPFVRGWIDRQAMELMLPSGGHIR